MVVLHVKRGADSQFLYETSVGAAVDAVLSDVVAIFNGRLKVTRLCYEVEELGKHGTFLPLEMQGLTDEQVKELKLEDPWGERCAPANYRLEKDPIGRRCGRAPPENLETVLKNAIEVAKGIINKKLVEAGACLTQKDVARALSELRGATCIAFPAGLPPHDPVEAGACLTQKDVARALSELRGATCIAFPAGLPPHDPVRQELDNAEDLAGLQASLEVIDPAKACLWACGKQLLSGNKLSDHLGRNDKIKLVVKLCSSKEGAPGREPVLSEAERKELMLHAYRKQEEWKKLEQDEDDRYLNSSWADSSTMKRQFHGLGDGVVWKPKLA